MNETELATSPDGETGGDDSAIEIQTRRKLVRARGTNQRAYLKSIQDHDLAFGIGPAGTGKTYLAVASAIDSLEREQVRRLEQSGALENTRRVRASLYGSLAHTGRGHGTDKAVMLGLQGAAPDSMPAAMLIVAIAFVALVNFGLASMPSVLGEPLSLGTGVTVDVDEDLGRGSVEEIVGQLRVERDRDLALVLDGFIPLVETLGPSEPALPNERGDVLPAGSLL